MSAKPWVGYDEEEELRIKEFCKENGIRRSGKEYYFTIDNTEYLISPHKVEVSDTTTNVLPWIKAGKCNIVIIRAKKSEVINIYNTIKSTPKPEEPKVSKPKEQPVFKLIKKKYVEDVLVPDGEPIPIKANLGNLNIPRFEYKEEPVEEEEVPTSIGDKLKNRGKPKIKRVAPTPVEPEPIEPIKEPPRVFKPKEATVKKDKKKEAMDMLLNLKRR